jgi:hypothetical protein
MRRCPKTKLAAPCLSSPLCMRMYPVDMSYMCTYHIHKVKKITKIMKKFTHIFSILPHIYIKFQVKIHYNLAISDRFINLDMSEILSS